MWKMHIFFFPSHKYEVSCLLLFHYEGLSDQKWIFFLFLKSLQLEKWHTECQLHGSKDMKYATKKSTSNQQNVYKNSYVAYQNVTVTHCAEW